MTHSLRLHATLSLGALAFASLATPSFAADAADSAAATESAAAAPSGAIVVTAAKTTRTATELTGVEIQKILPGVAAFRAIQTMPGVMYQTGDPWGNNEQNMSLYIHGFAINQLGYTLDGLPLGDLSYGNITGISPQRAVISENIGSVVVSTGAGELGIPSLNNLGGAIELTSADPKADMGLDFNQTIGSYQASRTYLRLDTGAFGADGSNSAYIAAARQNARAWDYDGRQKGWQVNAKYVHDNDAGKLTAYFDFSDKQEPNEDATTTYVNPTTAAQAYTPYTRPFTYPNFRAALDYVDADGNTPTAEGSNYRNYFSAALRTDYLGYLKYDANISDAVTWSNQVYYHHNQGQGVVAGPLGQSLSVVKAYYPDYDIGELVDVTGGSGYVTRVTQYRIDREGLVSTLQATLGNHTLELGGWYEHNSGQNWRRWYALDVDNPTDPYHWQKNALFTQYVFQYRTDAVQLHLQDKWEANDRLTVEGGVKSSLVFAKGWYPVQPVAGSYSGMVDGLPSGKISTKEWFLPALGAKYDLNGSEQLYFNIQKNMRNYGTAPWSQGSQEAFDYFKETGKPETSWTYEAGLRSHRSFPGFFLSALDLQLNYYHVDFSNRLLAVSTTVGGLGGSSITGGTTALFNVGGVTTDGADAALTLSFGPHFSIYNGVSFNSSKYDDDYTNGTTTYATSGKQVPGSPKWMNKTVVSANAGPLDLQLTGEYVGKRYATYTNDGSVGSYFLASGRLAFEMPTLDSLAKKATLSLNVTNIFDEKGASTISVSQPSSVYAVYPLAPRQWFLTFSGSF
ncbi:TonB-dependent receptor [Novosphingobium profundi]|uniref:TonB-dependent receptor n=1 Tax=Novosphingobium profundi TaxID=1774954 RepID=UPI001BDB19A1|nr:TonB-dependent receptor plug domain-containing protein [Novosphingobium profundi]